MIASTKSVLITGSSRGIGKSIAMELSRSGYSIVLHGRSESEHLDTTYSELKQTCPMIRRLVFDVGDREQCRSVLNDDINSHGMYYGIVLNAGVSKDNAFPFMSENDWDEVLSINLDSFYNVLKPLIEPLILARRGGRIVVVTSVSGIMGNRGQVNYSAAKAGLIGASKSLGLELARKNITVNCVAPGLIETDMTNDVDHSRILPLIPMRRIGKGEEVGGAVSFLMSEQAAYITRQTIAIDGGLS